MRILKQNRNIHKKHPYKEVFEKYDLIIGPTNTDVAYKLGLKQDDALKSFYDDLLEYPQYSRPEEWNGKKVPEVLLSGHHKNIEKWRLEQSIERTRRRRPDMYEKYMEEQKKLEELNPKKKKRKYIKIDNEKQNATKEDSSIIHEN